GHRAAVYVLREPFGGPPPDTQGRAVRRLQLRVLLFERAQSLDERVILCVGDFGEVVDVVKLFVSEDFLTKPFDFSLDALRGGRQVGCHTRMLLMGAVVVIIRSTVRSCNTLAVRGGHRSPVKLDDVLARARERGVVFEFGEAVDDSTEVFDAAQEVFEPYVLVGAVRVGAEVADAEGDDGRGRVLHAADRTYGAA